MPCIDDLFDWILEIIFNKLPLHDRLVCKMVLKRWYEILMKRVIFREDRHIYLRNCHIKANQAPMSVFMNAKHPYDIITIDGRLFYGVTFDVINLQQFGRHLNTSIREVVFTDVAADNYNLCSILLDLPLVQSITFKNHKLNKVADILDFIRRQERSFFLHNLKILNVSCSYDSYDDLSEIDSTLLSIKQFIPKDTRIIMGMCYVNLHQNDNIEKVLSIMETVKFSKLRINACDSSKAEMEMLLEVDNLCCERIEFEYSSEQSPYRYLEAVFNKHKHLKEVKLKCWFLPPPIEFPKITELFLDLNEPVTSLKPLEFMANLKTLRICCQMGGCGFGHGPITLMKLKRFHITQKSSCEICLKTLANSFCNLKVVEIIAENCSSSMIFKNWQNLEIMYVSYNKFELEAIDFQSLDLRILKIATMSTLTVTADTMEKLGKLFPNLEIVYLYSTIGVEAWPSLNDVIAQAGDPAFANLERLEIYSLHKSRIRITKKNGLPQLNNLCYI